MDNERTNYTLTDHLTELRDRIVMSAYAIVVGTGLCWGFSERLFSWVRAPIAPYLSRDGLVFTAPMDKFMAHIKLAVMGGFVLACPFWIYQIWRFVAPGLYSKEKKYAMYFIGAGSGLFLTGVAFVYTVVFPMAFKFLLTFGGDADKPMITINEYLSFFVTTTLVFGLAFELPLILTLLGIIGLIDQKFLKEKRRYAVVGLAIVSAIITPPDALSMIMLLIPLVLLYELSIIALGIIERSEEQNRS